MTGADFDPSTAAIVIVTYNRSHLLSGLISHERFIVQSAACIADPNEHSVMLSGYYLRRPHQVSLKGQVSAAFVARDLAQVRFGAPYEQQRFGECISSPR